MKIPDFQFDTLTVDVRQDFGWYVALLDRQLRRCATERTARLWLLENRSLLSAHLLAALEGPEVLMKLFFNKLANFLRGVKCPECGSRIIRNHSFATKTMKVVYVCTERRCRHVFGGKK